MPRSRSPAAPPRPHATVRGAGSARPAPPTKKSPVHSGKRRAQVQREARRRDGRHPHLHRPLDPLGELLLRDQLARVVHAEGGDRPAVVEAGAKAIDLVASFRARARAPTPCRRADPPGAPAGSGGRSCRSRAERRRCRPADCPVAGRPSRSSRTILPRSLASCWAWSRKSKPSPMVSSRVSSGRKAMRPPGCAGPVLSGDARKMTRPSSSRLPSRRPRKSAVWLAAESPSTKER